MAARVVGGTVGAGQHHELGGLLRKGAVCGANHRCCAIRQFPCPEEERVGRMVELLPFQKSAFRNTFYVTFWCTGFSPLCATDQFHLRR